MKKNTLEFRPTLQWMVCMILNCVGLTQSVAYLGGGPRCDAPPFGPTMKIFLQATLYQKVRFCHFQQELQNSTMFDGLFFIPIQYAIKIAV